MDWPTAFTIVGCVFCIVVAFPWVVANAKSTQAVAETVDDDEVEEEW